MIRLSGFNKLKTRVATNMFYLGIVQSVNYIFPILTVPYLVRTLGSSSFGKLSLVQIIIAYLVTLIDYGFNITITREISVHKEDENEISSIFSNIIFFKLTLSLVIFLIGTVYLSIFPHQHYENWLFATLVYLIGQSLLPLWYFQGIEKMWMAAIFICIAKTITLIGTFLFVKNVGDVSIAIWVYSIGVFIGGVSAVLYATIKLKVSLVRPKVSIIKAHLFEGYNIFLTSLLFNCINGGGIMILGYFNGFSMVGIYTAIDKLIKAGAMLFYSIFTQALFPSIAKDFSHNKIYAVRRLKKITLWVMPMVLFCAIVVMIFSKNLLSLIYSASYQYFWVTFCILVIWLIFNVLNNFIGIQFLVASGKGKLYRKSFLIATILILTCFVLLIRTFSINGLAFSITIGEIFLCLFMIALIRKNKLLI
jgi:PST family polysaccharide transporter